MHDQFFSAYLKSLHDELKVLSEEVLVANLEQPYQAGKLQGKAAGIKFAIEALENKLSEANT